jgi:hypothetical protein
MRAELEKDRSMRLAQLLSALCVSFLAALPARADAAGQVLAVVGEALALRADQIVALFPGAPVESGDHIHTGPSSNVQIRFTDWGFVSLAPARISSSTDTFTKRGETGARGLSSAS